MRPVLFITLCTLLCGISSAQEYQYDFNKEVLDSIAYENMSRWLRPTGRAARVNYQLHFRYDSLYSFDGALGQISKKDKRSPMGLKYKSASVAKTFFAVMILQLAEEGKLHLDSSITNYLHGDLIDQLHIVDGVDRTREINVRHLLQHTSGLRDYIFDDVRFLLRTQLRPRKKVSPEEHIKTYKRHGLNKRKTFIPGTDYHYTDTGYLLLGLILEQLTGQSAAHELERRICHPLNLENTYFDSWDSRYTNMMHQYHNRRNVTELLHPSVEFGGGGIICTNKDLARFIEGIFANELFSSDSTLTAMLDINSDGYGLGISAFTLKESWLGGDSTKLVWAYGHSGFFGVEMFHLPIINTTYVASIGQAGNWKKTPKLPTWFLLAQLCWQSANKEESSP